MTTLFLVRQPLNTRFLAAFATQEGVADEDQGYALHLALRRRFGTSAPQPFRLFLDRPPGPHLLGYAADPAALTEAASLPALDPRLEAIFPVTPELRAMPTTWREGARYGFDVRVRPVIRFGKNVLKARKAEGKPGGAERDAYMVACDAAGEAVDRETVYTDWLIRKFEPAVEIETLTLTATRRIKTYRSLHGQSGKPAFTGYEASFTGTLVVGDPTRFAALLAHGVGRHTVFGFGMLILMPPRLF